MNPWLKLGIVVLVALHIAVLVLVAGGSAIESIF